MFKIADLKNQSAGHLNVTCTFKIKISFSTCGHLSKSNSDSTLHAPGQPCSSIYRKSVDPLLEPIQTNQAWPRSREQLISKSKTP